MNMITHLEPILMKEFKDSGFTDDFGVSKE